MRTSDRGIAFICKWEGLRLSAYQDVAGVLTIGYGHTSAAGQPVVTRGMKITEDYAKAILAADLAKFEARVAKAFGRTIPQAVFDVAVSFDFNTGGINRASWVRAWLDGDMKAAAARLQLWNKAGGKIVQGLVNRRKAEAALLVAAEPSVSTPITRPTARQGVVAAILAAALGGFFFVRDWLVDVWAGLW